MGTSPGSQSVLVPLAFMSIPSDVSDTIHSGFYFR